METIPCFFWFTFSGSSFHRVSEIAIDFVLTDEFNERRFEDGFNRWMNRDGFNFITPRTDSIGQFLFETATILAED